MCSSLMDTFSGNESIDITFNTSFATAALECSCQINVGDNLCLSVNEEIYFSVTSALGKGRGSFYASHCCVNSTCSEAVNTVNDSSTELKNISYLIYTIHQNGGYGGNQYIAGGVILSSPMHTVTHCAATLTTPEEVINYMSTDLTTRHTITNYLEAGHENTADSETGYTITTNSETGHTFRTASMTGHAFTTARSRNSKPEDKSGLNKRKSSETSPASFIGGAVGGMVALAIICAIVIIVLRQNRNRMCNKPYGLRYEQEQQIELDMSCTDHVYSLQEHETEDDRASRDIVTVEAPVYAVVNKRNKQKPSNTADAQDATVAMPVYAEVRKTNVLDKSRQNDNDGYFYVKDIGVTMDANCQSNVRSNEEMRGA